MQSDYHKKILLPSGGFDLEGFSCASIRPLESSFVFLTEDIFYTMNYSEMIVSVIDHHMKYSTDISEMYFSDIFFLWIMSFHAACNSDKIQFKAACTHCSVPNMIVMNIQDLDVKYIDKNHVKEDFIFNDITVRTEYRKVKHNLWTSALTASLVEKRLYDVLKLFVIPQVKSFTYQGTEYDQGRFDNLLEWSDPEFLFAFAEWLKNEPFGIQNNLLFECVSCGHKNRIYVNDSLGASMNDESDVNNESVHKSIDIMLSIADSRLMTVTEAMRIPYSQLPDIQIRMTDLLKKKRGKDYLDMTSDIS